MITPGYSGTPLIKKLGINPDTKLLVINMPLNYHDLVGVDISEQLVKVNDIPDLIHLFAEDHKSFIAGMKRILPFCKKNPALVIWVSWYKKASGRATDLSEDLIRKTALQKGLVDIKVCAVSELWSGLKLVVPLAKR